MSTKHKESESHMRGRGPQLEVERQASRAPQATSGGAHKTSNKSSQSSKVKK